jgi:hypothetical protein
MLCSSPSFLTQSVEAFPVMAITQVITSPFSYHTETCSHDFHAAMAAFADLLYFAVFTKEVITYPRGNHCNLPML